MAREEERRGGVVVRRGTLGSTYQDGEVIVSQGDVGNCMYVVQHGEVEVVQQANGRDQRLAILGEGDFFGEMSVFQKQVRSATIRALGEARVMTVDKKTLLRRIREDPLLALNLLQTMSDRVRDLNAEVARLEGLRQ
jgi:CRP/FNR family transcriptional regulator